MGEVSASGMSVDRLPEDVTARARIRDVALELFAERGVDGTSLRGVATAAGVSTGLIQHHFRSKDGLRQACDEFAIGTLVEHAKRAMGGAAGRPAFAAGMYATSELSTRYLARALVDRSPAAAELFDAGAALAETWLSDRCPERLPPGSERVRDAAAAMGAMHLGTLALHQHLSRRIGVNVLDRAHAHRIATGIADVYAASAGFLDPAEGAGLRPGAEQTAGQTAGQVGDE